jgi:glycyl-tRNA synthetase beta chain
MSTKNLLVELFVEELPPKALKKLGESFSSAMADSLKAQGLAGAQSVVTSFASPRRLAVHLGEVVAKAADKPVAQKLMPVSVGLDANGQPTQALLKRLAGLGLGADAVAALRREGEGKAESLIYDAVLPGATLTDGLQKALEETLAKLPIPKVMSYQLTDGWSSVNFVRPAHRLVALHGAEVVPVAVLGLQAGRETLGHRFEAAQAVVAIREADSYESQMESEGAVIPGFAKRRAEIVRQLQAAAVQVGGGVQPIEDEALLDEVTGLVERPNVLLCAFEEQFLEVPQECLILTMKANQKYFPLLDASGKLTNRFLVVSNIRPDDASAVTGGNERVVRPRLADAKFFFDQDRKHRLEGRVPKLGNVVYHNKLGTQMQRIERLISLAGGIARALNADIAAAEHAALLAKADLVTEMVGEFPELQGIMGRYYALHDGEEPAVADAIEDHYKPRFAGDSLPRNPVGLCVALADKLDTLVGMYGIGAVPTGDKDPFALRRHALGVLRILIETPLSVGLDELLHLAASEFEEGVLSKTVEADLYGFMLDRLRGMLRERGYAADEIEAVASQNPVRIDLVLLRIEAVRAFRALPEAAALAAANKRIQNILKKAEAVGDAVQPALLQEAAERELFGVVQTLAPQVEAKLAQQDYTATLSALAAVRSAVDAFFDNVMVNADDLQVRANRLALLNQLGGLMNRVADISKLAA